MRDADLAQPELSVSDSFDEKSESPLSQTPELIPGIIDSHYHERDRRLNWNEEQIRIKLEKEAAFAQLQRGEQVDTPGFYDMCMKESPFDPIIHSKGVFLKNGRWVGVAYARGDPPAMEDAYLITQGKICLKKGENIAYELFAVFDGHNGGQSALFAKQVLPQFFETSLKTLCHQGVNPTSLFNVIKACFLCLDQEMKQQIFIDCKKGLSNCDIILDPAKLEKFTSLVKEGLGPAGVKRAIENALKITQLVEHLPKLDRLAKEILEHSGTTATVCVKIGNELWTGCVGDSRAILQIGRQIIQLNVDAKTRVELPKKEWKNPNKPEYQITRFVKSIWKRGGGLFNGAVNGVLNIPRALNDEQLKSEPWEYRQTWGVPEEYRDIPKEEYYVVSPRPKITQIILPPRKAFEKPDRVFLCMGSDGLWNFASCADASSVLGGTTRQLDAKRLVRGALVAGTPDNVTALVAELTPFGVTI